MSNFHYCNDCKKAVDLAYEAGESDHSDYSFSTTNCRSVCKECGGINWKVVLDTPYGILEEKTHKEIMESDHIMDQVIN